MTTNISEDDLIAFVDQQLDPLRRVMVEDYLAKNPVVAARVIADMRSRDVLKIVYGQMQLRPIRKTVDAAGRLEAGLFWDDALSRFRQVALILFFIGVGWLAHSSVTSQAILNYRSVANFPNFIEEALQAHKVEKIRYQMSSQKHDNVYDRNEIFQITHVEMPKLPETWHVADVQIFPSHQGLGIEASLNVGALGDISLYVVRIGSSMEVPPKLLQIGQENTLYWQKGDLLFALTGNAPPRPLRQAAYALFEKHG